MNINTIKAAIVNVKHYSGDVFDLNVSLTNSDGTALNLNGKSLLMQVKKKKTSSTALAELTTPTEIVIEGTSKNEIRCDKVIALSEGTYYYDIENITDNVTIVKGTFEVEYDVTRQATTTAAP